MYYKEEIIFDADTCRICMAPKRGCIKITSTINFNCGKITDMINYCYGLEMILHKNLPDFICNECALHLNVAYNLKKIYLNTEKCFLQYLELGDYDEKNSLKTPHENTMDSMNFNSHDPILDNLLEIDRKIILDPNNTNLPVNNDTLNNLDTDLKYIRPNLMIHFASDTLIELSDTDTDTDSQTNERDLNTNAKTEQMEKTNFECPVCPKKFSYAFDYGSHLKKHIEKKCKICGRVYNNIQTMTSHFNAHIAKKPFKCPCCIYESFSSVSLKVHIKKKHRHSKVGPKIYKCKLCKNNNMKQLEMVNHLQEIHKKKGNKQEVMMNATIIPKLEVYQCFICNRKLNSYHTLDIHIRLHQNNKLKYCYICKASFMKNMYLHFKQCHPGLPAYKCLEHCNQSFRTLRELEAHKKTIASLSHIGHSNQTTETMKSSIIHLNTPALTGSTSMNFDLSHPPIPPRGYAYQPINEINIYECYICETRFTNMDVLDEHIKCHKLKKCKRCHRDFGNVRVLTAHFKLKHAANHLASYR